MRILIASADEELSTGLTRILRGLLPKDGFLESIIKTFQRETPEEPRFLYAPNLYSAVQTVGNIGSIDLDLVVLDADLPRQDTKGEVFFALSESPERLIKDLIFEKKANTRVIVIGQPSSEISLEEQIRKSVLATPQPVAINREDREM